MHTHTHGHTHGHRFSNARVIGRIKHGCWRSQTLFTKPHLRASRGIASNGPRLDVVRAGRGVTGHEPVHVDVPTQRANKRTNEETVSEYADSVCVRTRSVDWRMQANKPRERTNKRTNHSPTNQPANHPTQLWRTRIGPARLRSQLPALRETAAGSSGGRW